MFIHGQVVVEDRGVRQPRTSRAGLDRIRLRSGDPDLTLCGFHGACDQAQEGRLSRPVVTHQDHGLTGGDLDVDLRESGDVTV